MLKIIAALAFLSLAVSSIYVFPSGLPQPTDAIFALAFFVAFFHAIMSRSDMGLGAVPYSLFLLTLWIAVVAMVWAMIYSSPRFLMDPLFWTYNLLVTAVTLLILRKVKSGERILSLAILVALFISAIGATIGLRDPSGRNTGFFNNPNQLAYFSICATACLMVLNDFRVSSMKIIAGYILGGIGLLSAASLGAIAGALGLVAALIVANGRSFLGFILLPVAALITVLALVFVDSYFENVISNTLMARYERSGTKIDDIYTERNYHRIVYFPEYNIMGAGSALHEERFFPHGRHEIHSSFGALLFNYGIVGLGFFLAYLVTVLRKSNLPILLTACAPLIYSITHMGLRFTMFWVLFAIILYKTRYVKSHRKA